MHLQRRVAFGPLLFAALTFTACGGKTPPAESPTESAPVASSGAGTGSSAPTASAAAPSGTPAESAGADQGKSGAAGAAPAPGAAPSKRSARDILELKETVFFLAFEESEPKKAAEASCTKSGGKDAKKKAACMAKAREQADEGYRFEQEKDGTMWWLVVRRKGNTLVNVHKVKFEYGAESDTSVTIKPEGKDTGTKPWKKPPAEVKFEVPNEYRIIVHDPEHGKLVYEAKSGIGSSNK
jgi:hypothetical protein